MPDVPARGSPPPAQPPSPAPSSAPTPGPACPARNGGRSSFSAGFTSRSMRRSEMPASAVSAIGQEIELERQRLAVEIATRENLLAEHQRIVGGGIQFDGEHAPRFGHSSRTAPCTCGSAAQRIGVLHAAAGDVRLRGSRCLRSSRRKRAALACCPGCGRASWSRGSNARGVPRSASSVSAQTTSAVSTSVCRRRQFQASGGQHRLRAVDQADAFLGGAGRAARCRRARSASRAAAAPAAELRLAFADQHQRHVGQRRQVAARPHAALRRHHRRYPAVQQVAQPLRHQRTNAGATPSPARWRGSASWRARPRAAAASPTPAACDRTTLRCNWSRSARGIAHIGQQPDTGVDAVDRIVALRPSAPPRRASAPWIPPLPAPAPPAPAHVRLRLQPPGRASGRSTQWIAPHA